MDDFVPKKRRVRPEKDRLREKQRKRDRKADPVGPRQAPPETPLYVPCTICNRTGVGSYGNACVCERGFVQTGFTQERYDQLIRDNDAMLLLLADVAEAGTGIVEFDEPLNSFLAENADKLEAVRSRTKPAE